MDSYESSMVMGELNGSSPGGVRMLQPLVGWHLLVR